MTAIQEARSSNVYSPRVDQTCTTRTSIEAKTQFRYLGGNLNGIPFLICLQVYNIFIFVNLLQKQKTKEKSKGENAHEN